ncbi:MAG TPA: thiamine-phosphate kinase [Dehalococcoidia bacterium]|jgi:thiamine-monophosphate kinase|nr:thiamine-phosphate kinase [Dehalococcoidia bacterium]
MVSLGARDELFSFHEFSLIHRIIDQLGVAVAQDIVVPPGDDAAVWATSSPGNLIVASVDAMTAGVHWLEGSESTMTSLDVGWRAVAASVSDIAAMGATPKMLLISLTLSEFTSSVFVDELVQGISDACLFHGVKVAGGDVVKGNANGISITVIGETEHSVDNRILRRDSAKVGDIVVVTGRLGGSAAGLSLIRSAGEIEQSMEILTRRHRRPEARVGAGRKALLAGALCAIDVSDGFLQDLGHVASASEVDIEVICDDVPLEASAVTLLGRSKALDLGLGGGEDYELALIFAEELFKDIEQGSDTELTVVGRVVEKIADGAAVRALDSQGEIYHPAIRGWDHGN